MIDTINDNLTNNLLNNLKIFPIHLITILIVLSGAKGYIYYILLNKKQLKINYTNNINIYNLHFIYN